MLLPGQEPDFLNLIQTPPFSPGSNPPEQGAAPEIPGVGRGQVGTTTQTNLCANRDRAAGSSEL